MRRHSTNCMSPKITWARPIPSESNSFDRTVPRTRRTNAMPFITLDNKARLFYRLEGNDEFPVLVLSHSIGTDHGMWEPQAQDLLPHFRVLRYDTRGHGAS